MGALLTKMFNQIGSIGRKQLTFILVGAIIPLLIMSSMAILEIERNPTFVPIRQSVIKIIVVTALLITAIFFVMYFVTKRIAQPISAIANTSDRIAHGCLEEKIAVNYEKGEFAQIENAVNTIAESLLESSSALLERDELFRSVVQNMPVMMNAFDADRNFIVWNRECEQVTGYKADEIINNPRAMELIYSNETNYHYVLSKWIDRGEDYRNWEMQITCKNGSVKTILWSNISNKFPIPGWDKWVVGVDVTKSRQMKLELVEKTIYMDNILRSARDMAIIAADNDYRIKYYNPMAEKIFGYNAEKVVGRTVFEVRQKLKAESDHFKRAVNKIHNEGLYSFIIEQKKDEKMQFIQIRISGILDINNKFIGYMLMAHDITERIEGERSLKRYVDELARSNEELEQFAYVASHDLQEPLRMISSYLQLLERRYKGNLDKEADEFIWYAVDGVKRMQELINDILAYSRIGRKAKDFAHVDCNIVLRQVLINLQTVIEEKGAVIMCDPLPTVVADELQMNQLFQNLVANAIKFCDNTPQLKIGAKRSGDEWLFSVGDNGVGIEREQFGRVFLMFQRLHSRKKYPGTGIGLPICKKIVERHGGRIWVESEPGKGSNFYFTIPVSKL